jgi:hypothetical protein
MTQEEINDKFIKENHCEKYLARDVSGFNPDVSYEVQTTTVFCVDEKRNPTEVADDLVCVTIYDSDEDEELDGASILLSRKETLSLIEKLAKAASLLRREHTD